MKNFLGALWKQVPVITESGEIHFAQLGIVAKKSDGDESWKAYIGVNIKSQTETEDIKTIIRQGTALSEEEARRWFPGIELKYRG